MSRLGLYIVVILGIPLFVLSFFRIDVFTYKDSNKLERIVMTTKKENLAEQYPVFPEGMSKDERLLHKEGVSGLSNYGFNQIKDYFKPKEGEGEEDSSKSQQASIPHRPHSVGKAQLNEGGVDLSTVQRNIPRLKTTPRVVHAIESQATGTLVSSEMMHDNFVPEINVQRIRRVFDDPECVLMASFSVDPLRPEHLNREDLKEDLLSVLAQFDMTAVQGIYATNDSMLMKIAQELSQRTGRPYRHIARIPTVDISMNRPVPVFFYDSNVLEMDPSTVKLVCKPNNPFAFPPLSTKFRVKKAPAEEAFTFIAVNIQEFPGSELHDMKYFPEMIARLKDDGTPENLNREDDVILFGYFGVEPTKTVVADDRFNRTLTWANPDYPTNTFGTFSYVAENILFQTEPLAEYLDNSGIWDLRRQFHRASRIPFDHHPVWACFSIYEGGKQ